MARKRHREVDSIVAKLEGFTLHSTPVPKPKRRKKRNVSPQRVHSDIFKIGKLNLSKERYTKSDVESLIEERETKLHKMFELYVQNARSVNLSDHKHIPSWVV